VDKPHAVLVDTPRTLFQVQELLKLASHQAHGYVVSMKGPMKLNPRHLVAILKSGGVASPPSTDGPTKLLGCVQSLLELSIMQEPKLGLSDAKPVIHLKRIKRRSEHRRVRHQEASVGGPQHLLVVRLMASSVHEVLCQHLHEFVLCG
jgi:hypothetical protein